MARASEKKTKRPSPKQDEQQSKRTLRQRDVNGKAVSKVGGAQLVDAEEAASASPPSKKRKLAQDQPAPSAGWGKKRRRGGDAPVDRDLAFLRATQEELKKVKSKDAKTIRPYLDVLQAPEDGEAHLLAVDEARRLLQSGDDVKAPVFVTVDHTFAPFLERVSERRPIEQFFDWMTDLDELITGDCGSKASVTVAKIRDRFLRGKGVDDGEVWNFPDIPSPFNQICTPAFVQTPGCNLLTDITHATLDDAYATLCTPECRKYRPHKCCDDHFLTPEEHFELHAGWRLWQGTVMLAEAGALTEAHWDRWSFGTYITCLEGEIGFAWLSNPTKKQLKEEIKTSKPKGRWLFKVLRPNDSLYMGPGTAHVVFRLPSGGQTLGLAGHIIQRADVRKWLRMLLMQIKMPAVESEDSTDQREVRTGLLAGVDDLLKKAREREELAALYGGIAGIDKAKELIQEIEELNDAL